MMIEIHSTFCISICSKIYFVSCVYKYTHIECYIHFAHLLWCDAVFFTSHAFLVRSPMRLFPSLLFRLSLFTFFRLMLCLRLSHRLTFSFWWKAPANRIRFHWFILGLSAYKTLSPPIVLSHPNETDDTYDSGKKKYASLICRCAAMPINILYTSKENTTKLQKQKI